MHDHDARKIPGSRLGRLARLATVGARAGSHNYPIDPHRATVAIQGVTVFAREPVPGDAAALRAKMRAPEVRIDVALAAGDGAATAWGCDLGYDYVKLNADYTSLIVQTADGQLAKDDRLTNYSPSFKRTLLVEALSYISRFAGTRCVIRYAHEKPALEQAFCDDVKLLRQVGLRPIVVAGGEREIADHLVALLNLDGAHAIGISGKDGGLLRAKPEGLAIHAPVLEMLLAQDYIPIVTPLALDPHGAPCAVEADDVAAELALALVAPKLIFLASAQGILAHGELVSELAADRLEREAFTMPVSARAILRAARGGCGRIHVIDGRTPHAIIAELFTDRGVGTLVL